MKLRSKGICILAGAGPGDIGLVTLRTKEAVEQAEVISLRFTPISYRHTVRGDERTAVLRIFPWLCRDSR